MHTKTLIYVTHVRLPSEKTPSPFILKTCEGLRERGWNVELWTAARHDPKFKHVDPFQFHSIRTRVPIQRIPTIDLLRFLGKAGFPLIVLSFAFALTIRLWSRRDDVVVYAHDMRDLVFLVLLRVPVFCEIHDFYESSLPFINRWVLTRLSGVIVTNSLKAKHIQSRYGLDASRILVQPNAVDADLFDIPTSRDDARTALGLSRERRIVMYTGHLYRWKGVYTLAESASSLPEDTDLYIVGGTDVDQQRVHAFIKKHSLPRIVCMPHQPHTQIPLFLKAADVVVLPNTGLEKASREETSPVKLFEYLASGTSLVVTELPSVREIVSETEAIFARPDDPEDLARAIRTALERGDEGREKRVACARAHSWEARATTIDRFIASH